MNNHVNNSIVFSLGDMVFAYDEEKNKRNLKKHGLPLSIGARVFLDMDRIEMYDEEHSAFEQRYNVLGDLSAGLGEKTEMKALMGKEIVFVVYTERDIITQEGERLDITRLISVRLANHFERGIYYANRR